MAQEKEFAMDQRGVRFDMMAWQVVPWRVMRDDVLYLERLDIGTVWVGDAYLVPAGSGSDVLDAWTTLGALAACTERVRLGTLISNVSLRHPAMLAKQAATVDCISGGRLDLGVGAGIDLPEDRAALGLAALTPTARIDRLGEAVAVMDGLLRGQRVSYHGTYYHLDDATVEPAPVQRPRPPLIVGGNGKRALQVVAQYADAWVSDLPWRTREEALEGIRTRNHLLDDYCDALNRDPATVERGCVVGWSPAESPFTSRDAFEDFVGRYREAGMQRFVFTFGSAATPAPYDAWVAAGRWATRETLEAFAVEAMSGLNGAANLGSP
jgi:alkanesulfonate monooxygenase SsuD/methylene tetrahydromethanopterin reductase-like flavin-dependent oxidoreductase (luciferase family)